VALQARASIVPVVIDCRPQFLSKNDPWYSIPPRAPHFEISILPALNGAAVVPADAGGRSARQALNAALEKMFLAELA
jgi:hypothetical protein